MSYNEDYKREMFNMEVKVAQEPSKVVACGEDLYLYWLKYHGKYHVEKWLKNHNYDNNTSTEFIDHMMNTYNEWVESNV